MAAPHEELPANSDNEFMDGEDGVEEAFLGDEEDGQGGVGGAPREWAGNGDGVGVVPPVAAAPGPVGPQDAFLVAVQGWPVPRDAVQDAKEEEREAAAHRRRCAKARTCARVCATQTIMWPRVSAVCLCCLGRCNALVVGWGVVALVCSPVCAPAPAASAVRAEESQACEGEA